MQVYELLVEGRSIRSNSTDNTLVRTSVGIDKVHVMFDSDEWLSFPVTVTFAQNGVNPVTTALTVSAITNSSEWRAEGTVVVPYEVIRMVGPIRVTFQGTDANGNHIITAAGSPLKVEEAGDVTLGEIPGDAPTVNQWQQAYANAQALLNEMRGVLNDLEGRMSAIVESVHTDVTEDAQGIVDQILDTYAVPATTESLGLVRVGSGLSVNESGVLSAAVTNGITASQISQLENLASLAYYCFDTTFDDYGRLNEDAKVKASAIDLGSMIDDELIVLDEDGKLTLGLAVADEEGF